MIGNIECQASLFPMLVNAGDYFRSFSSAPSITSLFSMKFSKTTFQSSNSLHFFWQNYITYPRAIS